MSENNKTNKVEVEIYGKEYTLRGQESEEYIKDIADYVDKKMICMSRNSGRLNTGTISVLTAVNIADEYFKLQNSIGEIKEQLKQRTTELENYGDEINTVKSNYTLSQMELAKLRSELEELKR